MSWVEKYSKILKKAFLVMFIYLVLYIIFVIINYKNITDKVTPNPIISNLFQISGIIFIILFGIIVLTTLLAYVILLFKIKTLRKELKRTGLKATAKIKDMKKLVGSYNFPSIYKITVSYNNTEVSLVTFAPFVWNELKLNDEVEILYDQNHNVCLE